MKPSVCSISLISLALVLVGCSSPSQPPVDQEEQQKPLVVTSFYPLYFFTSQIVGDSAEVINLAGASDVHDYSPSPQDMVGLNTADLVIYLGADLEPWTDDVIPQLQQSSIPTLAIADHLPMHDMEKDDYENGEHADEGEHLEDEDGHHHGGLDPHVWLDPVLAQTVVSEIRNAMITLDTNIAETYQKNADVLLTRLSDLDGMYATGLADCARTEAIISHDAFGYLARRYAFDLHPIAGLSTMDEPSAQVLAELKEEAEEGITHILTEENNVQRFATTLSGETGLSLIKVNPLGAADNATDYFAVMQQNLDSLRTALGCE